VEYLRKCKKKKNPISGFYYGLFRFIMDITGLFLRILLTLEQDPKKGLETLIFGETLEKSG
jgi:hypothetical protein